MPQFVEARGEAVSGQRRRVDRGRPLRPPCSTGRLAPHADLRAGHGPGRWKPPTLTAIEHFFQQRGAPVFHEVSPLADASIVALFARAWLPAVRVHQRTCAGRSTPTFGLSRSATPRSKCAGRRAETRRSGRRRRRGDGARRRSSPSFIAAFSPVVLGSRGADVLCGGDGRPADCDGGDEPGRRRRPPGRRQHRPGGPPSGRAARAARSATASCRGEGLRPCHDVRTARQRARKETPNGRASASPTPASSGGWGRPKPGRPTEAASAEQRQRLASSSEVTGRPSRSVKIRSSRRCPSRDRPSPPGARGRPGRSAG